MLHGEVMAGFTYYILTVPRLPEYGLIRDDPKGATKTYLVDEGKSFAGHMPKDAKVQLDKRHKGTKLCDFISNVASWLIVSERVRAILAAEPNPSEVYPLKVLDLKGRPIKAPYFFVHPVGAVDCVDLKKSEYRRSAMEPSRIASVQRVVLHQRKIPPDRTIFRLKEFPVTLIIRSDLLGKLKAAEVKGIQVLGLDTPVFI
jgi:hypothetical protein